MSSRIISLTTALLALLALASSVCAEQWVSIGPSGLPIANGDVIDGQVNALAVDPRDANVIYIGAAEGGVWKTRDGGGAWTPLTDTQLVRPLGAGAFKATMSIGALAIDPSKPDTIYVGTGEPNNACCFNGAGLGVFRSTDGGGNWTPTGINPNQIGCFNGVAGQAVVNRIVIVPGRQSVVFAATNQGLYRYVEGGTDCWTLVVANSLAPFANAIDLIADPYQGALYVGYASTGIFKSSNLNGNQWQQLVNGLPTDGFGRIALAFGGRTGVGFSQPLPIVYAGFTIADNVYRLFVTRDGGNQWTELPAPPHDGQLGFNDVIAVGPYSSDDVYIGQIAFWYSADGGRTGGANDYSKNPPITDQSWTVLGCCQTLPNPLRKGLDLHGDIHDIVFAPYGSFLPDPSQVAIVYVANDGGITKGTIDSDGVVTWTPLSRGLVIGQAGTIGLDPNDTRVSVSGFWHNGNVLILTPTHILPFGGGDGFGARLNAGVFDIYFDCNAGFNGSLCRAHEPFMDTISTDTIWNQTGGGGHWSDPHRPGHLLHGMGGTLLRATNADLAPHAVLQDPNNWQAVDPFFGRSGVITTMAFRSRALEETPVYYIGTSTGQVWRGSPEVPWIKLCECGNMVNAIAPDLFHDERIFVALKGTTSPGRIKELTRLASGAWSVANIDGTFAPQLRVFQVQSIAVDPAIPLSQGTAVYVGTDQGVYRGFLPGPPVATQFATASVVVPPIFDTWTWRRSPGIPNVWVAELQVHQNFQAHDSSGVIRAATYGRGLYELDRSTPAPGRDKLPTTLTVAALQIGEDGAPPSLTVPVVVLAKEGRIARDTPFQIVAGDDADLIVEVPAEIKTEDAVLAFVGWALPNGKHSSGRRIAIKMHESVKAVAHYQEVRAIPDERAKPLHVIVSAIAQRICVQSLTHEVELSWDIVDGQQPASVRVQITYPDHRVENIDLKPIRGSQSFPVSAPKGGPFRAHIIATDSAAKRAVADTSVELERCEK